MKVIILVAGEGKRLRPHTNEKPKCLVKIAGDSLLSRQLSAIKRCNIPKKDIALVGGYKSEALKSFKVKQYKNVKFSHSNMVTTLFCAREFMSSREDLIISYGDIVYEDKILKDILNVDDEISLIADKDWERLWRLRMSNPLDDAETFIMDDELLIKELGKKPISISQVHAQYIGLIKIRKDIVSKVIDIYDRMDRHLDYDGQNFDNMYMTSFIQHLIDLGFKVRAKLIKNSWLEVDTVGDLERYNNMVKDGSLNSYCRL
tara:strand:- start:156 stop:935 length:780 start_codon:yes stop_codon:yes gene_type:complete